MNLLRMPEHYLPFNTQATAWNLGVLSTGIVKKPGSTNIAAHTCLSFSSGVLRRCTVIYCQNCSFPLHSEWSLSLVQHSFQLTKYSRLVFCVLPFVMVSTSHYSFLLNWMCPGVPCYISVIEFVLYIRGTDIWNTVWTILNVERWCEFVCECR